MSDRPLAVADRRPDGPIGLAPRTVALAALALFGAELALASLLYKHAIAFHCRDHLPGALCGALSSVVIAAMLAGAGTALLLLARPALARRLEAGLRPAPDFGGVRLHALGLALVMIPLALLAPGIDRATTTIVLVLWGVGSVLVGTGALVAIARPGAIAAALRPAWPALAAIAAVAVLVPVVEKPLRAAWSELPGLAAPTLEAVVAVLSLTGETVLTDTGRKAVQLRDFVVNIGDPCAGIEGFVLVTGFMGLYAALFRDRVRPWRVAALLPLGLALSWGFNVLRIAALILIGAYASPELAVEGFHSHAGWLAFTILALGLTAVMHAHPWLRREPVTARPARVPPAFFADRDAARLVPFMAMMAGALLASTFLTVPALAYPARVALILIALWPFRALYRRLDWRLDPLAVGAGAGVGLLWIAWPTAPDPALDAAVAALPTGLFLLWGAARIVGTALVIPLVEELVFRGYLIEKLDPGGRAGRLLAVALSTAAFAALHGRVVEAGIAGLVFAALALRRGRLTDAVLAHAVANGLIAGWALFTGRWSLI